MTSYDIIIRPVITERSMAAVADKKYVFEVAKTAGKIEIKKAVEEIFGVCRCPKRHRARSRYSQSHPRACFLRNR